MDLDVFEKEVLELDKLEIELLKKLREKTGKSDLDLIKLAIFELYKSIGKESEVNYIPYTIPQNPVPVIPYPDGVGDFCCKNSGEFTGKSVHTSEHNVSVQTDFSEIDSSFKVY